MGKNNLKILSRQTDVSKFYNEASVVLNLSDKRQFVETFGLTALEAMSAGLPVIVPTEGGIAEMVEDGVNGYKMDVQELDEIEKQINFILSHREAYIKMSDAAYKCSQIYDESTMIGKVLSVINMETVEK